MAGSDVTWITAGSPRPGSRDSADKPSEAVSACDISPSRSPIYGVDAGLAGGASRLRTAGPSGMPSTLTRKYGSALAGRATGPESVHSRRRGTTDGGGGGERGGARG